MDEVTIPLLSPSAERALVVIRGGCRAAEDKTFYKSWNALSLQHISKQDLHDLRGAGLITWNEGSGFQMIALVEKEVLHRQFMDSMRAAFEFEPKFSALHQVWCRLPEEEQEVRVELRRLAWEAWQKYRGEVEEIFAACTPAGMSGEGDEVQEQVV